MVEKSLISVILGQEGFLKFLSNGEVVKPNIFGIHSYVCMLKRTYVENKSLNVKRGTMMSVKILGNKNCHVKQISGGVSPPNHPLSLFPIVPVCE